ncbi:hypothetical protein BC828DRAFT_375826 [Blastocladiella britannica]|nr:hypothetical protein BC828DRAFT_375826 [Blastocladiella britannica]
MNNNNNNDNNNPPFDPRGHRSICWMMQHFRNHNPNGPRVLVHSAYCFRRDPDHTSPFNPAAGLYLTRFVAEETLVSPPPPSVPPPAAPPSLESSSTLASSVARSLDPILPMSTGAHPVQMPSEPLSDIVVPVQPQPSKIQWQTMPEVDVGEWVAEIPGHAVAHVRRVFEPPLRLSAAYMTGFVDGTHWSRVTSAAHAVVVEKAPLRAAERIASVWETIVHTVVRESQGGQGGGERP